MTGVICGTNVLFKGRIEIFKETLFFLITTVNKFEIDRLSLIFVRTNYEGYMSFRSALLIFIISLMSSTGFGQSESSKWAANIGGSFIDFSGKPPFQGEGVNFQIPNLSLTRYIDQGFSAGGKLTVTGIDKIDGFYTNNYELLLIDIYGRYDFKRSEETWVPYLMSGFGMLVKDKYGRGLSFNVGTGLTYWITPSIGLNAEIVYRFVGSKYEGNFISHAQFSGGIVIPFGTRTGSRSSKRLGAGFCSY